MKVGCMCITWGEKVPKEKVFEEIKKAGYEGVELNQSLEWLGDPQELRRTLYNFELEISSFQCWGNLLAENKEEIQLIKKRIDYALEVRADNISMVGGWKKKVKPKEEDYKRLAETLEKICEYASIYSMEVTFHNHMGCLMETIEDTSLLLDYSPSLKLCLDTAHYMLAGSNPVEVVRKFGYRVGYVHLKDYFEPKGEKEGKWSPDNFVELGRGNVGLDFQIF